MGLLEPVLFIQTGLGASPVVTAIEVDWKAWSVLISIDMSGLGLDPFSNFFRNIRLAQHQVLLEVDLQRAMCSRRETMTREPWELFVNARYRHPRTLNYVLPLTSCISRYEDFQRVPCREDMRLEYERFSKLDGGSSSQRSADITARLSLVPRKCLKQCREVQ